MINIKFSVISGSAGIVLSLLVGLLSGARFPLIFIRAGIFGAVFFAIGSGVWILINTFIPDLAQSEDSSLDNVDISDGILGSKVNISVDDTRILTEMYRNLNNNRDDVGNISDLVSVASKPDDSPRVISPDDAVDGMDEMPQDSYTGDVDLSDPLSGNAGGLSTSDELGNAGDLGNPQEGFTKPQAGLVDMDSMTSSFMSGASEDESIGSLEQPVPVRSPAGNKTQELDGDFNPKELAAGIRTVLSKDE